MLPFLNSSTRTMASGTTLKTTPERAGFRPNNTDCLGALPFRRNRRLPMERSGAGGRLIICGTFGGRARRHDAHA